MKWLNYTWELTLGINPSSGFPPELLTAQNAHPWLKWRCKKVT